MRNRLTLLILKLKEPIKKYHAALLPLIFRCHWHTPLEQYLPYLTDKYERSVYKKPTWLHYEISRANPLFQRNLKSVSFSQVADIIWLVKKKNSIRLFMPFIKWRGSTFKSMEMTIWFRLRINNNLGVHLIVNDRALKIVWETTIIWSASYAAWRRWRVLCHAHVSAPVQWIKHEFVTRCPSLVFLVRWLAGTKAAYNHAALNNSKYCSKVNSSRTEKLYSLMNTIH